MRKIGDIERALLIAEFGQGSDMGTYFVWWPERKHAATIAISSLTRGWTVLHWNSDGIDYQTDYLTFAEALVVLRREFSRYRRSRTGSSSSKAGSSSSSEEPSS